MPFHNAPPLAERMAELAVCIERHYARKGRSVVVTFREKTDDDDQQESTEMTHQPDYSKAKTTAEVVDDIYANAGPRHPDADVSPVTIERSDAIDAAGALLMMARDYRRQAKSRANAGAGMTTYRRGLRAQADVFEAAARRVQSICDAAH